MSFFCRFSLITKAQDVFQVKSLRVSEYEGTFKHESAVVILIAGSASKSTICTVDEVIITKSGRPFCN